MNRNTAVVVALGVIALAFGSIVVEAAYNYHEPTPVQAKPAKPELEYRVLQYTCPGYRFTVRQQRESGDIDWPWYRGAVTVPDHNPVITYPTGCLVEQLEAYRDDVKKPVGTL